MEIDDQKLDIVSATKSMAVQKEELEKDSGMEESMGTSPEAELQKEGSASNSDDDDDGFCVRSHQRQSRVIVDDDDDDDDDDNIVNLEPVPEPDDDAPLVLDKDESDDEESSFIIRRKKKTSKDSSQNLLENTEILKKKELTLDTEIFDADGSNSDDDGSNSETDSPVKDKNLFDDENDEKRTDEDCEDDEGIDTEGLSQKLKAILKKGAMKKQHKRASKTMAEEKLQLHSETQRIIRESKVQIPYHQPESKSLDDFLSRAMRKQQQYRALKIDSQNERKKVEFVQDTITNDSILFKRVSLESATQDSQENSSQIREDATVNNPNTQSSSQAPNHSDPTNSDAVIVTGDSEASPGGLLTEKSSLAAETKEPEINPEIEEKDNSDDELPDLIISEEPSREEELTANVVEPELFDTIPNREPVKDAKKCDSEEVMGVTDSSTWVIDENGLLKTDDPLMDELVTADYKTKTEEANEKASLADNNVPETGKTEEKKEAEKEMENLPTKPKLSISQLLTPELKNIKPKLSGNWDQPIVFDENSTEEVKNTGLDHLVQRLLKHSNVQKEQKESKNVNIKIIQKEQTEANKQELCLNTITYQTDEPEHLQLKSDKPGAKLLLLKDKLQQQMRVKRESARQKRCEIFNLNNEDGFEEQLEENEEEEAELTDGSDTDVSEEDLIENDLGEDYGKEKRTHNAFVDEEAEEEEEEEEEEQNGDDEDEEHDEDAADDDDDIQSKEKREERGEILFDSHGESDSDSIIPESQNRPKIKKIIRNLILSDDESQNASLPCQDENEKDVFQKTDFLGTFPSSTNANESKTPSAKPFIQPLTMPAEDSQDLYKSSVDFQSPDLNSQDLRFPLESQASPMFDAQGFLRVKTLTKTVDQPKISALGELCDNDDNAEDLLGLCSGKFSGSQDDRMKSCRTLFTDSPSNSQFPASGSFPFSSKVKRGERKTTEDEEETEDFPSLKLISDDEDDDDNKKEDNDESSENEGEDGTEEEGRSDDDDEEEDDNNNNNKLFPKFRMKSSGKIRQEFVDDEAELSGSEFDSDENDNLNEEFDIMDEEEGDQDVNMTEDQLRNQVGRVHLKNMIDDDKREVMRLQEMYLPDGDLFSEGHGRTRRFRWKNLDDNSQQDMFNTESETEEKEEDEPDELKWRIERFEREKWIKEQEVQEKKNEEESSFFKFGRNFLKKKGTAGQNGAKKLPLNDTGSPKQSKLNMFKNFKKGSFLSRSSDSLAKIAEMTKPLSNAPVTNKTNGRNFVFSVVTPTETETPTATGPQKKKAESKSCPPAKKRKIEPVKRTLSETSVFRHIDKSFT